LTNDVKSKSRLFIQEHIVMIMAVVGLAVVSVAGALIVRAYLAAQSSEKDNPFGPMTYTNTAIQEETGDSYPFDVSNDPVPDNEQNPNKYSIKINKETHVDNLAGKDKKPVYIRVAVKYSAYKEVTTGSGESAKTYMMNVTPDYPVSLDFEVTENWLGPDSNGYFYYKYIVNPGGSTDPLFEVNNADDEDPTNDYSVTVITKNKPPKDVYYQIDISADTIQAVAHDRSNWTSSDYENDDAYRAWVGHPTLETTTKPTT